MVRDAGVLDPPQGDHIRAGYGVIDGGSYSRFHDDDGYEGPEGELPSGDSGPPTVYEPVDEEKG